MTRIKQRTIDDLIFSARDLGFEIVSITTHETEYGPPTVDMRLRMTGGSNDSEEPRFFAADPETEQPIPEKGKMRTLDDDAITQ